MIKDQKILCLDYGRRRVGVAVNYGSLAEPLTVLTNDETVLSAIAQLIAEHQAQQLLVGISDGAMAKESEQFGTHVAQSVGIPVVFADETLSSQSAEQKRTWLAGKARRKAALDHLAAAEILQQWLDEHL